MSGKIPYRDFSLFKTPLYTYALSFIFVAWGNSFSQVRATSIIFEALTLVGIYLLGKKLRNGTLGLVAAATYATSYFSILMNNYGKSETLFNIFLVFSIYFLVKWQQQRTMRNLSISALLLSLAFLTLPRGAAFILPAYILTLVAIGEWRNSIILLAFFGAISALLSSPFFLVAPVNFIQEVFLFNMVRAQPTTGLTQSVESLTGPADAVLSFSPALSILINRPVVLPQNPSRDPDLINYFPFRTFLLLVKNGTQPFNPFDLLRTKAVLREVQTRIQAREFSAMLSEARILVLEEPYLNIHIPEYTRTFGQVIKERCELLKTFAPNNWISVYSVKR